MNTSLRNTHPWETPVTENSAAYYYGKWLHVYEQLIEFLEHPERNIVVIGDEELEGGKGAAPTYRSVAIDHLRKSLECKSEWEQRLVQIRALLLLVKLHSGEWEAEKDAREWYFYEAVRLAQEYSGEDFQNTLLKGDIIQTYGSLINPKDFYEDVTWDMEVSFMRALWIVILTKSEKRALDLELRTKHETESIMDYLKTAPSSDAIIKKLESIFGSIRLSIISENSSMAIMDYNDIPTTKEATVEEKVSENTHSLTVDIFDKPRRYTFAMDCENREPTDRFTDHQLNNVINPLLSSLIKNKERLFYTNAYAHNRRLKEIENSRTIRPDRNDYHAFVTDVIRKCVDPLEFHEALEDADYIETFLKALDICRSMTVQWRKWERAHFKNLPQEIDTILGGKIERKTLQMAKSMLLSRDETMNGSGYPSSLSKKDIPLECRIYSVIRTYETLSYEENPKKVIQTMKEWSQDGHFDTDIFRILLENLDNFGGLWKLPTYPKKSSIMSTHRKQYYASYAKSVSRLLDLTKEIGETYYEGRLAEGDVEIRNIAFLKADKLQSRFLSLADTRKIITITRHGPTASDTSDWPPGSIDELITEEEWVETSLKKWSILQGLRLKIFTSPFIRAKQTSAIVCQQVRGCLENIMPVQEHGSYVLRSCETCPAVRVQETLINPPKNLENRRHRSMLTKMIKDSNVEWLEEFLVNLLSSPEESMYLFVTHRDTARHLIALLENVFREDGIVAEKYEIAKDGIYEVFFRWNSAVSGDEARKKGLFFTITNWKPIIQELNVLAEEVFGEAFYELADGRVNLIVLHDRFLDFVDARAEESPERLGLFMEELNTHDATKHFYDILKTEGVVE